MKSPMMLLFDALESQGVDLSLISKKMHLAAEEKMVVDAYRDGRTDQQSKEPRFYNRNAKYYFDTNFKND